MKPKRPIKIGNQVSYPGGSKALALFITKALIYPPKALEQKIEGEVYLQYDINYKGIVFKTKIIHSVGHGCDAEAIRLVKLLRFQVTKSRGVKSIYHKKIKIRFKLPITIEQKSENPNDSTHIQYELTRSKPTVKKNKLDPRINKGYSYSITI